MFTCRLTNLKDKNELKKIAAKNDSRWYVLWTQRNHEQIVHDQLKARGFESFLPKLEKWTRPHVLSQDREPMFPGHLFLKHRIDRYSEKEVCNCLGMISILGTDGEDWESVPEHEMEAVRKVDEVQYPARRFPYLRDGKSVRVLGGPLQNVQGIFVKINIHTGIVVISIGMLQKSIGVKINTALLSPLQASMAE